MRNRIEAVLRASTGAPASFAGEVGDHDEAWAVGEIVVIVPTVRDDMPHPLKDALTVRRDADITGRCGGCGATRRVTTANRIVMVHGAGCVAADPHVRPLIDAWRAAL
jgi:hypothetical protein